MRKLLLVLLFVIPTLAFADPAWVKLTTPSGNADLMRLSVPHGWLVTYKDYARGMAFIPDEKHEWVIENKLEASSGNGYVEKSDIPYIMFIGIMLGIGISLMFSSFKGSKS